MGKKIGNSLGFISDNIKPNNTPHIVKNNKKPYVVNIHDKPNSCVGHPNFSQEVWDAKNPKKSK